MFHKGSIDKKSPAVLSKLSKQVAIMYDEVERMFNGPALDKFFDKSWLVCVLGKGNEQCVSGLGRCCSHVGKQECRWLARGGVQECRWVARGGPRVQVCVLGKVVTGVCE